MNCPICDIEFERQIYHEIEIDVCPECQGIWFDKDELKPYIDSYLNEHPDISDAPIELERRVIGKAAMPHHSRACPRCNEVLKSFNYAVDSNVIIDKCPECGGMWSDAGEMNQLAQFFKGNPTLHGLGVAIAAHHKETVRIKELTNLGEQLSQSGTMAVFFPKIILPLSPLKKLSQYP